MHKKKIAVDQSLTPVKDMLRQEGYDVVGLEQSRDAECIIVSGGAENTMGIHTTKTKAPCINAEGRSAADIVSEVKTHMH